MRKAFMCSLCHKGILGGGLYLDTQSVTYKTQKVTVDKKYRKLVLPLRDIEKVTWKWLVFPIATFHMSNGEEYRLLIYNKKRFWRFNRRICN